MKKYIFICLAAVVFSCTIPGSAMAQTTKKEQAKKKLDKKQHELNNHRNRVNKRDFELDTKERNVHKEIRRLDEEQKVIDKQRPVNKPAKAK